jgi:hypothetical protein
MPLRARGTFGSMQIIPECHRFLAGSLTPPEAVELRLLQDQMLRYRESIAPLPLADVRRLHQELVTKAQQQRS